jgi:DNA ligase-1
MLAESFGDYINAVDWQQAFVQPKLDGHRCLARNEDGQIRLYSRKGTLIETMGHIQEVLQHAIQPGETLDGELFVHGEITFQQIASAIRNSKKAGAVDPTRIQYHVYDAMLPGPFGSRYSTALERLRRLPRDIIVPVKTLKVATPEEVMAFQADCLADGYEGAMLRHGTQAYQAGKRSRDLLKVKTFRDAEFDIVAVAEGRGTHIGMAIFSCVVPGTNAPFDVLAPGSQEQIRELYDRRAALIGRKLTVKFQEWTTTTPPVPRFPVAVRVHDAI